MCFEKLIAILQMYTSMLMLSKADSVLEETTMLLENNYANYELEWDRQVFTINFI